MKRGVWIAAIITLAVVAAAIAWQRYRPAGEVETTAPSGASALPAQRGRTPVAPPPPSAPAPRDAKPGSPAKGKGAPPSSMPALPPAPPRPAPKESESDRARVEVDSVALNIRHFGQRFGGNPVGTNAEIVKTLMGGNEARATYLPPDLQRLNENGELIDRWGTPYFFHQNSAEDTEVRSAGPDKTLWTPDDIIAN